MHLKKHEDIEMTNDRIKHMPWKALRMFVQLGEEAQTELERRAIETWDREAKAFKRRMKKYNTEEGCYGYKGNYIQRGD